MHFASVVCKLIFHHIRDIDRRGNDSLSAIFLNRSALNHQDLDVSFQSFNLLRCDTMKRKVFVTSVSSFFLHVITNDIRGDSTPPKYFS